MAATSVTAVARVLATVAMAVSVVSEKSYSKFASHSEDWDGCNGRRDGCDSHRVRRYGRYSRKCI